MYLGELMNENKMENIKCSVNEWVECVLATYGESNDVIIKKDLVLIKHKRQVLCVNLARIYRPGS